MKPFFTGQFIKAEMLVMMLEKHGITARYEFTDPTQPDDGDLSRECHVFVSEEDFELAWQLFYAEREDEL